MSEDGWRVIAAETRIDAVDPTGGVRSVRTAELSGVMIETNDSGPFEADVWWLLFGADDKLACAFPQGAVDEQLVVDRLRDLPAFDHEAMIMAMGSTTNAVFPVWRRGL